MRCASAPTHETGFDPARCARGERWPERTGGESSSSQREGPISLRSVGLVEPPIETTMDVIERVASVLRMGSIRTW